MQSKSYFYGNTLHMIEYTSQHQLKVEEFGNLHQMKLNPENRWIKMAFYFPWDKCVAIYSKHFADCGRTAINPRIVIGSLIIKHKLNFSDEQTVQIIEENPYMQFFLGCDQFAPEPLFSPSLFVEWRKKLGNATFNDFSDVLATICNGNEMSSTVDQESGQVKNKGKLKLDATVADQYIAYPNDLGLLNTAREKTEAIIDLLFDQLRNRLKVKPRTYRKKAREKYLAESKKRQTNKKTLRSAIRFHLNCLDRNIKSINMMLDMCQEESEQMPLKFKMLRSFWIIQTLNDQQRGMYSTKSHSCKDRIVSVDQPQVRPIVRGKAGKKTEFGTKVGLTLAMGIAKAETLSWDAYNESADLIPHVESYRQLYGHYPEVVMADGIYGTNKNRNWCKQRNIRMTVAAKGKKPQLTAHQKRKRKKEFNERNHVEGKFGQAKQGYGLNKIKAKLSNTSHAWIGMIILITNLVTFAKVKDFCF